MKIISDIETDNIIKEDISKIWLFGGIDADTGERYKFEPFRGKGETEAAIDWANSVDMWIGHNFISYDAPVVNSYLRPGLIPLNKVLDTYIISRTVMFDRAIPKGCRKGAHSLEAWGIRFGLHKGDFKNFGKYSEEMVEYWERDLDVTEKLYKHFLKYINDPQWKKSFRCEHDVQVELDQQKIYGFQFDSDKAEDLLVKVLDEKNKLEAEIQEDYPPQLQHVHTLNYTKKKNGEEGVHVKNAREKYAAVNIVGDKLECYSYVPFNPGSPTQRIDKLWEADWKPFEKTKTHQRFSWKKVGDPYGKTVESMSQEFYDKKKEHLEYYGWTCGEDNLATLPENAPKAAKKLAQWLTLEGRRSSLVEWLGEVKEDGRIHGTVFGIGSWTGRMSHTKPNTANISSVWPESKTANNAVEEIKKKYDSAMRSCWTVPDGSYLVGVDAEGIQLRILGDQLWRHYDKSDYAKAIDEGDKELETDIHNVNKRALSLTHLTRDDAKTFDTIGVLKSGELRETLHSFY